MLGHIRARPCFCSSPAFHNSPMQLLETGTPKTTALRNQSHCRSNMLFARLPTTCETRQPAQVLQFPNTVEPLFNPKSSVPPKTDLVLAYGSASAGGHIFAIEGQPLLSAQAFESVAAMVPEIDLRPVSKRTVSESVLDLLCGRVNGHCHSPSNQMPDVLCGLHDRHFNNIPLDSRLT